MSDPEREARARALIGSLVAGRYRLDALLGLGATGAVYRAAHPDGHAVAVKILDPELMASDAAHRFIRESELVLGIHHPNVVRTLAAGADEALGILYLAMPLLSGEDLDVVLQRTGALDPGAAARIAIQAARGIGAAHRVGVVHRDIKPGNLFLHSEPDGRMFVRVCDFGIAKRMAVGGETSFTAPGSQLGTPDYVAPEQLKDSKSVDQRADIWGLGATFYEMLSGTPPFAHHATVFDVIAAILSETPPHIQDRAPWIEPAVAAVVHRALRRDPAQRFQSMQDFIDALSAYSGGDDRLTRAHIAPPSPVVRNVRQPRLEATPSTKSAKRPAGPPTSQASPPSSAGPPSSAPLSASIRVGTAAGALHAAPAKASPPAKRQKSSKRRSKQAAPKRKSRAIWLLLLLLVILAAAAVFLWQEGMLNDVNVMLKALRHPD